MINDHCHADQGQGGAQGIEDGIVLGMVLHGASSPRDIERRLQIYERIRRSRASAIQILSNVGQDQTHIVREELLKYMRPGQIPSRFRLSRLTLHLQTLMVFVDNPTDIFQYTFGYDVVRETLRSMREYDGNFNLPADFFENEVVPVPGKRTIEENVEHDPLHTGQLQLA